MSVGVLYLCNIIRLTARRNNVVYAKKDYFSSLYNLTAVSNMSTRNPRT